VHRHGEQQGLDCNALLLQAKVQYDQENYDKVLKLYEQADDAAFSTRPVDRSVDVHTLLLDDPRSRMAPEMAKSASLSAQSDIGQAACHNQLKQSGRAINIFLSAYQLRVEDRYCALHDDGLVGMYAESQGAGPGTAWKHFKGFVRKAGAMWTGNLRLSRQISRCQGTSCRDGGRRRTRRSRWSAQKTAKICEGRVRAARRGRSIRGRECCARWRTSGRGG